MGGTAGVWVTLTPAEEAREAFWAAAATAVEDAGLVPRDSVLSSVPHVFARAANPERLLVRGLNQVGGPMLLALGDLERATDPQVAEDICALVRQCAHLSVVVAGRASSTLEDPSLELTLDRTLLPASELDFTVEEPPGSSAGEGTTRRPRPTSSRRSTAARVVGR